MAAGVKARARPADSPRRFALDLECVPVVQNAPANVSLELHPGLIFGIQDNLAGGIRVAFDVEGHSWGVTPLLNRTLYSARTHSRFGEVVLPIRFVDHAGGHRTSVGLGVHVGVGVYDSFYDIGVVTTDAGRGARFAEIPAMQSTFKTPTLRNVDQRAYMHNGSVATLEAVVDFYDRGGLARRPSLSTDLKPLGPSEGQKRDLVAFLRTLTSEDRPIQVPTLPH